MTIAPRLALVAALALAAGAAWTVAAEEAPFVNPQEASAALGDAEAALRDARGRSEALEARAAAATASADRTAQEAAALAARIQESQAQIAVGRAQVALLDQRRAALRRDLAAREAPLVRLTGALELVARRPLVFSLLRPGSLRDTVYLRAMLSAVEPEITRRTAGLRGDLDKARALLVQQQAALGRMKAGEAELGERRARLTTLLASQRLASREAQGIAARESDRVLALAEQSRDLAGLMGQLDADAAERERLAALPGPIMRPARPEAGAGGGAAPAPPEPPATLSWIMPATGSLVSGFGERTDAGPSRGVSLAPGAGALIVAPAAGRVAFAGPYRGYGRIVILEHPGGWTTLITGFDRIDGQVGDQILEGAPLGLAASGRPVVTIELRKDGVPVNPLAVMRR